ncbi:MAG TPA: hypothetical protein VM261_25380 [Kofleriaceae bacterium]|nr:hypothetical protein [Kofleriaceae bacterium]
MRVPSVVAVLLVSTIARADLGVTYQAGDIAGLRRAGADGQELVGALRSTDRATVQGAIVAAEAAPDAWALLEPLAVLAGDWDRATAGPAARAAARISRALDGDAAILDDVSDERLAAIGDDWQALAERADRWSDVRVHALEVATRVNRARAATADDVVGDTSALVVASADADPQLRRAALELVPVPAPVEVRAALVTRISVDTDPGVKLAAAQALCAAVPEDAAAVLSALGEPGLEALRAAVATPPDDGRSGGALLDAARCLAADRDPRSVRALVVLRQVAPRPVRAAVARVAADVRARLADASP